jgi:glycosyltransferase involved in cell wall biosynthesis
MRIAITVDPEIPVPPTHYGGIERIVAMLVDGLVARGHAVTLFAHPASRVPCRLIAYPALRSTARLDSARNMALVARELLRGGFDLVHSFARLAYLLPLLPLGLPKLMSYQRHITARSVQIGDRLSRHRLHYTGCSAALIAAYAGRPNWHVVPNGVPEERYTPRYTLPADAPLVFLGRVEAIKGAHIAVEVARRSGRRLLIAGNVPPEARSYFETQIAPHLDGSQIRYLGPVDDAQKDALLGGAAALLMPITWDEPFGIVMAEALACGTPVLGFRRGAVPEVVEHGVTGFVCANTDAMVAAVEQLGSLSRHACRAAIEQRFGARPIVSAYEHIYQQVIAQ